MSDIDPRLRERFAAYRSDVTTRVAGPGPDQARRTLRRRRRTAVVAAAAAVVLVAAPVVANAALHGDRTAPVPGVSVDPTAPPTGFPSPSPSETGTTTPRLTAPPPDGHLTRSQLLGAPVPVPAWRSDGPQCPSGQVRLTTDGARPLAALLVSVDHGDVDRDGAAETVVRLRCLMEGTGPEQVVVYDRDANGRIVALGQVVALPGSTEKGWLETVEVRSDGQIRVQVMDQGPGSGWPVQWVQHQWRTFRWDGSGFDQVLGETALPVNPYSVDLSVTSTDLRLTKNADGSRSGTIDVRIRHLGGREATGVDLRLDLQWGLFPVRNSWTMCRNDYRSTRDPVQCRLGPIRPGAELTVRLSLEVPQGYGFTPEERLVSAHALGPEDQALIERNEENNQVNPRLG
ncbi:hypothetical protein [Micromonospora sp. DT47]|uniref:hypothetical protein n=1 Tax=Micromonospora sp. DT47 TaxID=3393431 RepID=UPI003CF4152D